MHFKDSLIAYLVKFIVTNILKELEALEIAIHLHIRATVNLANISSKIAATHENKYEIVFIDLEPDKKTTFSLRFHDSRCPAHDQELMQYRAFFVNLSPKRSHKHCYSHKYSMPQKFRSSPEPNWNRTNLYSWYTFCLNLKKCLYLYRCLRPSSAG